MDTTYQTYKTAFTAANFHSKLKKLGGRGTFELLEKAFQLYYLAKSPTVPLWAKGLVVGALGYFIVTPDAVPDITPILGFADDLSVMLSALAAVAAYLSPEIKERAAKRLEQIKP